MTKKKIDDEKEVEETDDDDWDEAEEVRPGDQDTEEDEAEAPHVDDTPPKPEKVGNIDRLVFLKEYSRDINKHIPKLQTS